MRLILHGTVDKFKWFSSIRPLFSDTTMVSEPNSDATSEESQVRTPKLSEQTQHQTEQSVQGRRGSIVLTWSDQAILGLICFLLSLWVIYHHWSLSNWGREEIRIQHQQPDLEVYRVDLNQANWLELSLLEGIGEVLGKRIVAYREEQGGFETIEQLMEVKGIGLKKYARIEQQLFLTPWSDPEATP